MEQLHSVEVRIFDKPYKVFGYPGEGWFNILAQTGSYTEFNVENLRRLIKPDYVCLDIGANIGVLSLAMASLVPNGSVYAFEGSEITYAALDATVKASGFENIRTFSSIVGRNNAQGSFVEDPQWRSSSHYLPSETGSRQCVSIDSLNLPTVDFIKIDVEGGELDVLDGAMETLKRCQPVVVMEFNTFAFVHYREITPRQALKRIFEIFPNVCFFHNRVGQIVRVDDQELFLRNNFFNGFVDDLLCFWS